MVAEQAQATQVTDEQLHRWKHDTASMLSDLCRTTNPATGQVEPIQLLQHQVTALRRTDARDDIGNLIHYCACYCWAKGDGKSLMAAGELLNRLLFWNHTENYILANTERQGADVLFRELVRIIRHSPKLRELWPIEIQKTAIRITITDPNTDEVIWHTSIEVLPCSMASVEGKWVTPNSVIASDEAHRATDDEPFSYLKSQAGAKNALMVVSSQAGPPEEQNPIYKLKEASESDDPEVSEGLIFDYHDAPRTPWGKQQAARDKATDPPPLHDAKWKNAWVSGGYRLLDANDVDAGAEDYLPPATWGEVHRILEERNTQAEKLNAGLDRSLGYMRLNAATGDATVFGTVVRTADEPAHYYVVQCDVLGENVARDELLMMSEQERSELGKNEVIEAAGRARRLGCQQGTFEQYNAGDIVGEVPLEHVTLRPMSTPRKQYLYNLLYQLVTAGRLHYSRFWQRLIDELKSITFDPSGATVKYEGKPHDDCVDMVLNALDGVVPQPDEDENEQEEQMALEDMMPQFRRVAAGAAGHGLDMRRPDLMGEPVRAGAAAL